MPTDETKRKLIAVVHADVKGYSRMMGEDDEYTVRTLTSNRQEMYRLVELNGGQVRDTAGDGFLIEFSSVVSAVKFSVQFQREMKNRNQDLPEPRKMEFRIGINIGDVIHDGATIHGDGVNVAARLEGLASPGGICISGAAYEQVKKRLEVGFEYIGEKSVKNIAEAVPTYRILLEPIKPSGRIKSVDNKQKRRRIKFMIAAGIILLTTAAAIRHFHSDSSVGSRDLVTDKASILKLPAKPSIAVLPFINMSEDTDQEYFSDGMTEDLITDLSKVEGLFVIARNSVFTYKGKPVNIKQVARELGVRYVMEGSVRRKGDRVRINAQLIDASTGGHVWAERYDGQMENVFVLQDSITQKIVTALKVRLTPDVQKQLAKKGTENPEAYDAFLRGWSHYQRHTPEDLPKAVIFFEDAVNKDPQYSRAYAALALVYWEGSERHRWKHLNVSYTDARLRAKNYLKEAMKSPTPLAHAVASQIHKRGGLYQEAIADAAHAIALDSSDPIGYRAMAEAMIWSGNSLQSSEFISQAMRLDPHNSADYLDLLGITQFNLEQFDKAVESLKRYINRNPDAEWSYLWLAAAYGQLGHDQEAISAINSFNERMEKIAWNYMSTLQGVKVLSLSDKKDEDRLRKGLQIAGVPLGSEPVAKATRLISRTKEGHFAVEGAPTLEVDQAKALLDSGALMIDVRPDSFWNRGHIPSAIHPPDDEGFSREWLSRVAKEDEEIIMYCEGAD